MLIYLNNLRNYKQIMNDKLYNLDDDWIMDRTKFI